jgi:hypothetical protein
MTAKSQDLNSNIQTTTKEIIHLHLFCIETVSIVLLCLSSQVLASAIGRRPIGHWASEWLRLD